MIKTRFKFLANALLVTEFVFLSQTPLDMASTSLELSKRFHCWFVAPHPVLQRRSSGAG